MKRLLLIISTVMCLQYNLQPIHFAAFGGSEAVVEILIKNYCVSADCIADVCQYRLYQHE